MNHDTASAKSKEDTLRILWSIADCLAAGDVQVAPLKDIWLGFCANHDLEYTLAKLTEFERVPGIPAHIFGLVAMAKRALISDAQAADFHAYAHRILGTGHPGAPE